MVDRNPGADLVAQLVGDPAQADLKIGIVGDQVIEATPADVGKVVTVNGDGDLVLAAGTAGGIQTVVQGDGIDVDATDPDNPVVAVSPTTSKGYIEHGADATVVRPLGYASVEWYGTVEPDNWIDGDTWNDPT